MKRFSFYLIVSLITHVIGITGVLFANYLPNAIAIPRDLPEVTEEIEIIPLTNFDTTKLESLRPLPKFLPLGRGCGSGYVQSYSTYNGQRMSEGVEVFKTTKKTRSELNEWIKNAVRIIKRVPNYKNRWGDSGERIVIVNPPNEKGQETVSVLWYGGGNSVTFIDAPTLELALEFERTNAYAY